MAPSRREFLMLAAGAGMVRSTVGRVVFCRVSHESVADAVEHMSLLFDGERPHSMIGDTLRYRNFVAAFRKSEQYELVLCGTDATLVLDCDGWRRFA